MADPTRDLLTGLEAIDKKIEQINADARSASTELQAIQNSGNIDATATTRMAELKRIIDNGLNEINQLTERRMQEIEKSISLTTKDFKGKSYSGTAAKISSPMLAGLKGPRGGRTNNNWQYSIQDLIDMYHANAGANAGEITAEQKRILDVIQGMGRKSTAYTAGKTSERTFKYEHQPDRPGKSMTDKVVSEARTKIAEEVGGMVEDTVDKLIVKMKQTEPAPRDAQTRALSKITGRLHFKDKTTGESLISTEKDPNLKAALQQLSGIISEKRTDAYRALNPQIQEFINKTGAIFNGSDTYVKQLVSELQTREKQYDTRGTKFDVDRITENLDETKAFEAARKLEQQLLDEVDLKKLVSDRKNKDPKASLKEWARSASSRSLPVTASSDSPFDPDSVQTILRNVSRFTLAGRNYEKVEAETGLPITSWDPALQAELEQNLNALKSLSSFTLSKTGSGSTTINRFFSQEEYDDTLDSYYKNPNNVYAFLEKLQDKLLTFATTESNIRKTTPEFDSRIKSMIVSVQRILDSVGPNKENLSTILTDKNIADLLGQTKTSVPYTDDDGKLSSIFGNTAERALLSSESVDVEGRYPIARIPGSVYGHLLQFPTTDEEYRNPIDEDDMSGRRIGESKTKYEQQKVLLDRLIERIEQLSAKRKNIGGYLNPDDSDEMARLINQANLLYESFKENTDANGEDIQFSKEEQTIRANAAKAFEDYTTSQGWKTNAQGQLVPATELTTSDRIASLEQVRKDLASKTVPELEALKKQIESDPFADSPKQIENTIDEIAKTKKAADQLANAVKKYVKKNYGSNATQKTDDIFINQNEMEDILNTVRTPQNADYLPESDQFLETDRELDFGASAGDILKRISQFKKEQTLTPLEEAYRETYEAIDKAKDTAVTTATQQIQNAGTKVVQQTQTATQQVQNQTQQAAQQLSGTLAQGQNVVAQPTPTPPSSTTGTSSGPILMWGNQPFITPSSNGYVDYMEKSLGKSNKKYQGSGLNIEGQEKFVVEIQEEYMRAAKDVLKQQEIIEQVKDAFYNMTEDQQKWLIAELQRVKNFKIKGVDVSSSATDFFKAFDNETGTRKTAFDNALAGANNFSFAQWAQGVDQRRGIVSAPSTTQGSSSTQTVQQNTQAIQQNAQAVQQGTQNIQQNTQAVQQNAQTAQNLQNNVNSTVSALTSEKNALAALNQEITQHNGLMQQASVEEKKKAQIANLVEKALNGEKSAIDAVNAALSTHIQTVGQASTSAQNLATNTNAVTSSAINSGQILWNGQPLVSGSGNNGSVFSTADVKLIADTIAQAVQNSLAQGSTGTTSNIGGVYPTTSSYSGNGGINTNSFGAPKSGMAVISEYMRYKTEELKVERELYDLDTKKMALEQRVSSTGSEDDKRELAQIEQEIQKRQELLDLIKKTADFKGIDKYGRAMIGPNTISPDLTDVLNNRIELARARNDVKASDSSSKIYNQFNKDADKAVSDYLSKYKQILAAQDKLYALQVKENALDDSKKGMYTREIEAQRQLVQSLKEGFTYYRDSADELEGMKLTTEQIKQLNQGINTAQAQSQVSRASAYRQAQPKATVKATGMTSEDKTLANSYLSNYKQQLQLEREAQRAEQTANAATGQRRKEYEKLTQELKEQLAILRSNAPILDEQNRTIAGQQVSEEAINYVLKQRQALDQNHLIQQQKITAQAKQQKGLIQQIAEGFKASFRNLTDYSLAYQTIGYLRQMVSTFIQTTKEMDKNIVSLQIATGESYAEIYDMMKDFNSLGQEMGRTTSDVAQAADDWLRAGYAAEEANQLIEASMNLSTLGQIESADATSYLISMLRGWKMEVEDVTEVVDKLTAVDRKEYKRFLAVS